MPQHIQTKQQGITILWVAN